MTAKTHVKGAIFEIDKSHQYCKIIDVDGFIYKHKIDLKDIDIKPFQEVELELKISENEEDETKNEKDYARLIKNIRFIEKENFPDVDYSMLNKNNEISFKIFKQKNKDLFFKRLKVALFFIVFVAFIVNFIIYEYNIFGLQKLFDMLTYDICFLFYGTNQDMYLSDMEWNMAALVLYSLITSFYIFITFFIWNKSCKKAFFNRKNIKFQVNLEKALKNTKIKDIKDPTLTYVKI